MSASVIDLEGFELLIVVFVAGQDPNLLLGLLQRLLAGACQLDTLCEQFKGFFQGEITLLQARDNLFQFLKLCLEAWFTSGHLG